MKTFLWLTAHQWWMLDTLLAVVLAWVLYRQAYPGWDPKRGFEPTNRFDFDDWCAPEPQPSFDPDPWNAVLYEQLKGKDG